MPDMFSSPSVLKYIFSEVIILPIWFIESIFSYQGKEKDTYNKNVSSIIRYRFG